MLKSEENKMSRYVSTVKVLCVLLPVFSICDKTYIYVVYKANDVVTRSSSFDEEIFSRTVHFLRENYGELHTGTTLGDIHFERH